MEFIGGTLMEILLMSYLAGTKAIVEKYLSKMTDKKITFIPLPEMLRNILGLSMKVSVC